MPVIYMKSKSLNFPFDYTKLFINNFIFTTLKNIILNKDKKDFLLHLIYLICTNMD